MINRIKTDIIRYITNENIKFNNKVDINIYK